MKALDGGEELARPVQTFGARPKPPPVSADEEQPAATRMFTGPVAVDYVPAPLGGGGGMKPPARAAAAPEPTAVLVGGVRHDNGETCVKCAASMAPLPPDMVSPTIQAALVAAENGEAAAVEHDGNLRWIVAGGLALAVVVLLVVAARLRVAATG